MAEFDLDQDKLTRPPLGRLKKNREPLGEGRYRAFSERRSFAAICKARECDTVMPQRAIFVCHDSKELL